MLISALPQKVLSGELIQLFVWLHINWMKGRDFKKPSKMGVCAFVLRSIITVI